METVYRPLAGITGASAAQARIIGIEGHWGRDPRAAAPVAPDVANPITPTAQYGYDQGLNLWLPVNVNGGYIVEKFSELIATLMASQLAQTAELTDDADAQVNQIGSLVELINARLGGNQAAYLWQSLLSSVNGLGFRKILNVDAGAYTAPAAGGNVISFTGVNLNGRTPFVAWNLTERKLHQITAVVDPVAPAVGTITLETPVGVANTVWVIPYLDTPHSWNSALDADQMIAVVGDPPRVNGPSTFISVNAALAANFQYVMPCALYGRYQIEIVWYTMGTTQVQFNIFGKYSDTAWAALGTIPAGYSQNTKFQTVAGIVFGAPPVGGGAAATPNVLVARMQEPDGFHSFAVEMNSINRDAVAVVVTGTYRLQGGTT